VVESHERRWKNCIQTLVRPVKIGQLTSQIVTGRCPECKTETLLVSFEPHLYRCVNCGYDLEQKVNGVIKYVIANDQTKFKSTILPDEEEHG
jgi:uncharacterized protein (DUF983 family)|tara:strand:- start:201 stop:476 length:276 start_codon:yes stop_codon:yes gene_type:complete